MEVRRLDPNLGFAAILRGIEQRATSNDTRASGNIVIRETLSTADPDTGVATIFGVLPDGTTGLQQWVGDTEPPPIPSTPNVSSSAGTITIVWDGTFTGGAAVPPDFSHCNAYAQKVGDSFVYLAGSVKHPMDSIVYTDLVPGDKWVFWLTSKDVPGNESARSTYTSQITVASVLDDTGLSQALEDNAAAVSAAMNAVATKSTIYSGPTAPTGVHRVDDVWFNTSLGNKPYKWDGTNWVDNESQAVKDATTNSLAAQSASASAQSVAASAQSVAASANTQAAQAVSTSNAATATAAAANATSAAATATAQTATNTAVSANNVAASANATSAAATATAAAANATSAAATATAQTATNTAVSANNVAASANTQAAQAVSTSNAATATAAAANATSNAATATAAAANATSAAATATAQTATNTAVSANNVAASANTQAAQAVSTSNAATATAAAANATSAAATATAQTATNTAVSANNVAASANTQAAQAVSTSNAATATAAAANATSAAATATAQTATNTAVSANNVAASANATSAAATATAAAANATSAAATATAQTATNTAVSANNVAASANATSAAATATAAAANATSAAATATAQTATNTAVSANNVAASANTQAAQAVSTSNAATATAAAANATSAAATATAQTATNTAVSANNVAASANALAATATATANTAQVIANGKNSTFIQSTTPTASANGDSWIDTGNGNLLKTWSTSASSWQSAQDAAIAAAASLATAKGKTIASPTAPVPDLSYAWSGATNASTSLEKTKGTTTRTNLATNPSFEASSGTVNVRTNYCQNPRAVTATLWSYQAGTTEASTQTLETGAGPNGLNNFIRRTITTAKTGGNSGFYRNEVGLPAGVSGDVWASSLWVRCSVAINIKISQTFRLGAATVNGFTSGYIALTPNVWTQLTMSGAATGDFDGMQVWAVIASGDIIPVGGTLDATQMQIEKAPTTGTYFDGATPITNLCTNPSLETDLTGWVVAGAAGSTLTRDTSRSLFGSASAKFSWGSGSNGVQYGPVTVAPGETYTVSFYVYLISGNFPTFSVCDSAYGNQNSMTPNSGPIGSWTRVSKTLAMVAGQTTLMFYNASVGSSYNIDGVLIERSTTLNPYYEGQGDFTYVWSGTANASTSYQQAPGLAVLGGAGATGGLFSAVYKSTVWASKPGGSAIRITPTTGTRESGAYVTQTSGWTLTPGKTYTISATCYLPQPLTSPLGTRALQILVDQNNGTTYWSNLSTQAPNVAGSSRVSMTFTVNVGATSTPIYVYNGTSAGGGDVWWDDFLLEEGTTLGTYFDGSTLSSSANDLWVDTSGAPPKNTPNTWNGTAWSVLTDKTASDALTSANGKNTVTTSSSAASGVGKTSGDVWFQINGSNVIIGQWTWTGSAWQSQTIDDAVIANLNAAKIVAHTITSTQIAASAITGDRIVGGTITAAQIATDTITAGNIAAGAITASEIAANSVSASALAANSITATALAAQSITATALAAQSITATAIKTGTIDATHLAAQSITATALAAQSITATALAAQSITATAIKTGTIDATHLAAQSITATALAAQSITATALAAQSITATAIKTGTIDATHLAAQSITATALAAQSITATAIKGLSITASAIAANSITATALAAQSITATAIASQTITATALAAQSITATAIKTGTIDATHLAANSITATALAAQSITATALAAQSITATAIASQTITATALAAQSITATAIKTGTIDATHLAANSITATALAAQSITATALAAQSITATALAAQSITATAIKTGTIDATHLAAQSITATALAAQSITATAIKGLSITASAIAANSITATALAAQSITATAIASQTITATALAAQSITATAIKTGTIDATHLAANSITATALAAQSITATALAAQSITATAIKTGTIDATHLAANSITATALDAQSITATALAAQSITATAIKTGTIDATHLAANSITATALAAQSITATALAAQSITATALAAQSITATAIASQTITATALAAQSITATAIKTGTIDATHLAANSITATALAAQSITATAIKANSITATALAANSITATALAAQSITATAIAAQSITATALAAQSITATAIAAQSITATAIASQSITASAIASQSITASAIAANSITASAIASQSITASALGAQSVTASAIKTGTITASSGIIADINADVITSGVINANFVSVGAGINALSDPSFNSATITDARETQSTGGTAGWALSAGTSTGLRKVVRTTTSTADEWKYLTDAHTYANAGQLIPVSAGQVWNLKVDVQTSTSGAVIQFRVFTANADGTVTSATLTTTTVQSTNQRQVSATYTVPAGVTGFLPGLICNTTAITWTVFGNAFVAQQVTGDLLVNGAIDGKTITGATIQTAVSGARIVLDGTSLNAWNTTGDNYFNMSSSTGVNISSVGQAGFDITRTNYCSNPSLEVDISGWTSTQTVVRDTVQKYLGAASLKVTHNATADRITSRYETYYINGYQTMSTYVRHDAAAARNMYCALYWTDNAGTPVSGGTHIGGTVSVPPNTWTRVSVGTSAVDPVGSTKIRLSVVGVGFTSAENMWVDAVQLENLFNAVNPYIDGSTATSGSYSYVWRGTAGLSVTDEHKARDVKIKTGGIDVLAPAATQQPGVGFILPTPYTNTAGLFSDGQIVSLVEGASDPQLTRVDVGNQQVRTWSKGDTYITANGAVTISSPNGTVELSAGSNVLINGNSMSSGHVELTNPGFAVAGGNVSWDIGTLAVDTAASTANYASIAAPGPSSGSVKVLQSGYYSFSCMTLPQSGPGNAMIRAILASNSRWIAENSTSGLYWELYASTAPIYLGVNDSIRFLVFFGTAATASSRVVVHKHVF